MARRWVPFLAALVLAPVSGCRGRTSAVVGTWDWTRPSLPPVRVEFGEDGRWTSPRGGDAADSGSWELSGSDLSFQTTTIDPPIPDPNRFALSEDGRRLVGRAAEDGTMVRSDGPAASL